MAILLLETVHEEALILLEQSGLQILQATDEYIDYSIVKAIITRGIGQVTLQLIDRCPNLQVVARCGVGLDNINTQYCKEKSIPVIYAPGSNANTVAEHTIAFMLLAQRNILVSLAEVKKGNWGHRAKFDSDELSGKTLGILGMGNIGEKVANLGSALGMKLIYWSRMQKNNHFEYVSQDTLLASSDIISVHLALNEHTSGMLNKEAFQKMKPNCLLINTARHQIINEGDLIDALEKGTIKGYAADVPMAVPPKEDNRLISLPNAYITAHVSSLTAGTYRHMCVQTIQNILDFLAGKQINRQYFF